MSAGRMVLNPENTADRTDVDPDKQDIPASLEGDPDAFARIVKRYENRIAHQMWRFTRDRGELEELVQDVFIEAYFSLKSYRWQAPFIHWLRKIATRVGYRYWKRLNRERKKKAALLDYDPPSSMAPENRSPSEAGEFLHQVLERLPPPDRMVLTLFYFEELNTTEIAGRLGWTRTLVKVRAHRARKKLRVILEEAGLGKESHD